MRKEPLNSKQKLILSGSILKYDTDRFVGYSDARSVDMAKELTGRYNDRLERDGRSLGRTGIRSKNMIDIRKLPHIVYAEDGPVSIPTMPGFPEHREFIDEVGWLASLPCLKEAVVRVNTFRYIHYKVAGTDVGSKSYDVYLHDYIYQNGRYLSGVSGDVNLKYGEGDDSIIMGASDAMLFTELYRLYPQKVLGWTDKEMEVWNRLVIGHADEIKDKLQDENGTDQFYELAKVFVNIMILVNLQLYLNKPSRPVKKKAEGHPAAKVTVSEEPETPGKFVRTVGNISIMSEKVPKLPTVKTAIEYKTKSWPRVGHIRRLPSGGTTYVKESIHHRHALQSEEASGTMQKVIKFK